MENKKPKKLKKRSLVPLLCQKVIAYDDTMTAVGTGTVFFTTCEDKHLHHYDMMLGKVDDPTDPLAGGQYNIEFASAPSLALGAVNQQ